MSVISGGRDISSMTALLLLSNKVGANPFMVDMYKKNALHFLLLKGHKEQTDIVDAILKRPDISAHINDVTTYGDTAMHIACIRRDKACIIKLLEKGAKLDITNGDGHTSIDLLRLDAAERLEFLKKYLTPGRNSNADLGELTEVATIDETFDSDPDAIEKNINSQSV